MIAYLGIIYLYWGLASSLFKNFMAFGDGMRFCIGADFSKVQTAVFLHSSVTKYSLKLLLFHLLS